MDNLLLKLDHAVGSLFAQWDVLSTAIFGFVVTILVYVVVSARDPDSHPMLLARQAQLSPIRSKGESAVFRSHSIPHGYPLNTGLNVKDPGDSKWSRGRDGDLRDVWRKVISGHLDSEGKDTGQRGVLSTVLGSQNVLKHDLADLTRQINLIGQHVKQHKGQNLAIYLPNSIEFLLALFAGAFYNFNVTLLPYGKPLDEIIQLLKTAKSDAVVAAVGSFPFDTVTQSCPALKQLIWVVDEGSKHMDWNEVPEGTGGAVNVSTWQQIIQDHDPSDALALPDSDRSVVPKNVFAYWADQLVEFTQANLIAGIAGQLSSIPSVQRISHTDLFLPVDTIAEIYPLIVTLSALFANASVALNSVAGRASDLVLATQGVAPTVIVAGPDTLAKTCSETAEKLNSSVYRIVHWFQARSLVQNGVMPIATMFSKAFDSLRPIIGTTPGKLRLIFVSEQVGVDCVPLSSQNLSDLRIYTGARIVYALTCAKVAGAVTQTGIYDYRLVDSSEKYSHFGAPLTSVEIFFKDTEQHKTSDEVSAGEIHARGPAVVGGEAALGIPGKIRSDYTLALI